MGSNPCCGDYFSSKFISLKHGRNSNHLVLLVCCNSLHWTTKCKSAPKPNSNGEVWKTMIYSLPEKLIGRISKKVHHFHDSRKKKKELKQKVHFDIVAHHVIEDPFAII
jgi:hypothetical protein